MIKVIVIDGTDATGKETQTNLLAENLKNRGFRVKTVSFPRYENESSCLVSRYLNGNYGTDPNQINPYAASLLYSADRVDYFLSENFSECDILLCDRYTTSNLIHQGSKIDDPQERERYSNWLLDLEFKKLGLPEPDSVIYLKLDPELSQELIQQRDRDKASLDIHESHQDYLKKCAVITEDYAQKYGWNIIDCNEGGNIRSIENIQEEILTKVLNLF